jgi:flagellar biogenesis protein FliO
MKIEEALKMIGNRMKKLIELLIYLIFIIALLYIAIWLIKGMMLLF